MNTDWRIATIERTVVQTSRVVSLFLRVDDSAHVAGQHMDVRLTAPDGYQAERSYSIASRPGSSLIELAVERLEEGEVSSYLCDVAQAGDTIELRGPIGGHFVWQPAFDGPILLIGGGSGVVPLMSIARARAWSATNVDALLLYSARTWEEIIFRDELLNARSAEPNFTFIAATTRDARRRPTDFDSRLTRAHLHDALARWGHNPRHVYVCGSNAFVESIARDLELESIPPNVIRTERYGGVT